ncbi:hypothetical protein BCS65_19985 [Vibrio cyclitrophicus]
MMKFNSQYSGLAISLCIQGLGVCFSFLLTYLVSSKLFLDDSENVFWSLAIINVALMFATLGLPNYVIKKMSEFKVNKDKHNFIYSSLLLVFFVSIIVLLLLLSLGMILNFHISLFYSLPIWAMLLFSCSILQSAGEVSLSQVIYLILFPGGVSLSLYLSEVNSFHYASLVYFLVLIFCQLYALYCIKNIFGVKKLNLTFDLKLIEFPYARDLMFSQVLTQIGLYFGQIYLGYVGQEGELSGFVVAQKISLFAGVVLIAANKFASPKMAKAHAIGDIQGLKDIYFKTSAFVSAVSFPITLIIVFSSSEILGFFGERFIDFALPLYILVFGQFINLATGSIGYLMMMTGGAKTYRNVLLICTVISVLLTIILVPCYGAIGAAIGLSALLIGSNLTTLVLVLRKYQLLKVDNV